MNVEARGLTLENVLKKGVFIIPDYQREYDWDYIEVDEFLEDINNTSEGDNYFIGHMVLEGEYNGVKFNVIDGQQRITTITIMLSVIRDLFYDREENDLAEGINENYIFGKDRKNNEYVILQNNMPYPVLQAYVQSIPKDKNLNIEPVKSGEKKIIKIYDRLHKSLSKLSLDKLSALRDKILDLELIFVAVSDQVDAFTIFETLNATGKDLTPLDLIKNQIFRLYRRQPQLDEPNDSWKIVIANTEGKSLKFLNNFWSSRFKKVSNRRVYKEFIEEIVKKGVNINDFLKSMFDDSYLFKKINSPEKSDWKDQNGEIKVFYSLYAIIEVFNIEVANSILLGLLREYNSRNISLRYLLKALNTIERYHFINNAISSNRSSGLDTMYAKFSRNILTAANKSLKHREIDKMIDKLEERIPSQTEYSANFDDKLKFSSKDTKQKKLVQYVLNKIEMTAQNNNVDLMNLSLEHIYPENPNTDWTNVSNKELIFSIGNLVLLDKDLNSEIGNESYNGKKVKILAKSTLISTKAVFDSNNDWNENSIETRKLKIADFMYDEIWTK